MSEASSSRELREEIHLVTFGAIYEMLQGDPDPVRFGYRTVSSDGGTFVELLRDGNSLERDPLPPGVDPAAHAMRRLREAWISGATAPATVMEPGIISRNPLNLSAIAAFAGDGPSCNG